MEDEVKEELNRRRAGWTAFAAAGSYGPTDGPRSSRPSVRLDTSFCYAAETWTETAATSGKLPTTYRAIERCLLKFNRRTQAGLRSSDLRGMSRLRHPAEYISKAKH